MEFLRRLSIRAMLNATLVCFAVLILMIAALGFASSRMANEDIRHIENVDIQMVDSMNRAYILRLNAFLRMESYAARVQAGGAAQAAGLLAEAEDFVKRAQDRFDVFKAAPPLEDPVLRTLAEDFAAAFGTALNIRSAWSRRCATTILPATRARKTP